MKVFIAHTASSLDLAGALSEFLHRAGHSVTEPFSYPVGTDVLNDLTQSIRTSDALVAILTDDAHNVLYELGVAAGSSRSIIVAANGGEYLPADVAAVPYVRLSGNVPLDAALIASEIERLTPDTQQSVTQFTTAEETLRAAVNDPRFLESIGAREFEKLVVQLLNERGFIVRETEPSVGGGADIFVESPKGGRIFLVECKKYSRQSRVSAETIARLASVVGTLGASLGVVVATSGFTPAAVALSAMTPVVLRSISELLAARSEEELIASSSPPVDTTS